MRSLIVLVVLIILSIIAEAGAKKAVIPPDIKYSIISKNIVSNEKRSLDIRINKRVSKDVLKAIALKLKAQEDKKYKRTFIGYYLPNMEINAGYWASTHFNPSLEVKIYGISKDQYSKLRKSPKANQGEKIVGNWLDKSLPQGKITIYTKDGKLFIRKTYNDGSVSNDECKKYKVGRQVRIKKKTDKLGDFFVIDKKGYLWHGDSEGLWGKCKKL